jgi:sirohydrochlorin cobaltochelatase
MGRKEIAFTKQCALATKDWDTFQIIIRKCLSPGKPKPKTTSSKTPIKTIGLVALLLLIQILPFVPYPVSAAATDLTPSSPEKTAIVVASFGTTVPQALSSITNIVNKIKAAFPQTEVRLTFTSNIIRSIWKERRQDSEEWLQKGIPREILEVKNIISTIGDLREDGYETIIVQPTHMFFMEQSHDLQQYVSALGSIRTLKERWRPFKKIVMGRPALGMPGDRHSYHDDIRAVAKTLIGDAQKAKEQGAVLVYMGHGNEHWSTGIYGETQKIMRSMYPEIKTYIGVVEGMPSFHDVIADLGQADASKVMLKPFMIVAGDHAVNDMAGPDADSWKSRLTAAGYEVNPVLEGLGSNDDFAQIFIDHIRDVAADSDIKLK